MNAVPSYRSASVCNIASGTFTGDGTAITLTLGFVPRWIQAINETDVETWQKTGTMGATKTIKTVTAGTTTVDTASAIVINSDGTVTFLAAEFGSNDVVHWVATG